MVELMLFLAIVVAIGGLAADTFKPLTQKEAESDEDNYTPRGWY